MRRLCQNRASVKLACGDSLAHFRKTCRSREHVGVAARLSIWLSTRTGWLRERIAHISQRWRSADDGRRACGEAAPRRGYAVVASAVIHAVVATPSIRVAPPKLTKANDADAPRRPKTSTRRRSRSPTANRRRRKPRPRAEPPKVVNLGGRVHVVLPKRADAEKAPLPELLRRGLPV